MTLPAKIDIQIIDSTGRLNSLANVLFGLKVFTSGDSWYNYSAFKSDAAGHVTLTRQDIIDNTELKLKTNIVSTTPTKFELYVWKGQQADEMIKMTKHLLALYSKKGFVEQDLKQHGIADENIPKGLEASSNKASEDKAFYEFIKDAVNSTVKVDTVKLEGVWNDSSPKSYQFIISQ